MTLHMLDSWYLIVFVLSFMCTWKRNNICYQLIVIVFLTDVPKPMTTLVGRFLPVPAKLNLITQQVSYCFNKKTYNKVFLSLEISIAEVWITQKVYLSSVLQSVVKPSIQHLHPVSGTGSSRVSLRPPSLPALWDDLAIPMAFGPLFCPICWVCPLWSWHPSACTPHLV